jgi:hypothetical protein
VCAAALLAGSAAAFALAAEPPTPSPSPSPTPSAVANPCGSILSIVNGQTISTGVCPVERGQFDIETGYTNTITTGVGGGNTATYGVSLIRFGTGDSNLDLEWTPPSANRSSLGGTITTGWSDTAFGAKYLLGYNANLSVGVSAEATLPTGDQGFTAGAPQYTGDINWGYTINPVLGINGTLGFDELRSSNTSGGSRPYFGFEPTLEVTATLPGPSELYAEYAYFSRAGAGEGSKGTEDFGYIRDFGSHLQADVEFGSSPTMLNGQRQYYVGAGISFLN